MMMDDDDDDDKKCSIREKDVVPSTDPSCSLTTKKFNAVFRVRYLILVVEYYQVELQHKHDQTATHEGCFKSEVRLRKYC